jgi:hypothetical protein
VITVFQRLGRRIGEAKDGSAIMIQAFDQLGVSFDDLTEKSEVEIFDQILDAARELPPTLAKARIGKILDIEGLKLIRVLIEEFGSVAETVAAARAAGAIRSQQQLDAAEAFAESLRRFGDTFGNEVIPGLLEFGKIITENTPTIIAGMQNLTIALKAFVKIILAIPKFGASVGEAAFDVVQRAKQGRATIGGNVMQFAIDTALRNIQEIRDISARAEKRNKAGDVTGVYGS